MARDAQEPMWYETRATADVGEDVLVLWVAQGQLVGEPTRTRGTTLGEFMPECPKGDALVRDYGGWVLTGNAGGGDGYRGFLFARPKTAKQKRTPWQSYVTLRDVEWPDMLLELGGVLGTYVHGGENETTFNSTAGSTVGSTAITRESFEDRYRLIKGGMLPTRVRIERWQSATEFTGLFSTRPMPDVVSYAHRGVSRSFLCLHEDVTVPEQLTGARRVAEFGTPNALDLPPGMFFPATNMVLWQPYVLRDEQVFNEGTGLYERERVTVLVPPPMPEPQRLGGG